MSKPKGYGYVYVPCTINELVTKKISEKSDIDFNDNTLNHRYLVSSPTDEFIKNEGAKDNSICVVDDKGRLRFYTPTRNMCVLNIADDEIVQFKNNEWVNIYTFLVSENSSGGGGGGTGGISDAPNNGKIYGRKNRSWVEVKHPISDDAPQDAFLYARSNGNWVKFNNIEDVTEPTKKYLRKQNSWVEFKEDEFVKEANNDGKLYARKDKSWESVVSFPEAPVDGFGYVRKNKTWVKETEQTINTDAPSDNDIYGRKGNNWEKIKEFVDAPVDGNSYLRKNKNWVKEAISEDAPNDNKQYVRKNNNWEHLDTQGTILEAPNDSKYYTRKSKDWASIDDVFVKDTNETGKKFLRIKGNWEEFDTSEFIVKNNLNDNNFYALRNNTLTQFNPFIDANNDSKYYVRKDNDWFAVDNIFIKDVNTNNKYLRTKNSWVEFNPDDYITKNKANDSKFYALKNDTLTSFDPFVDANSDTKYYARKDGNWEALDEVFLKDAESNNKIYGRKDGAWEEITLTGGSGGVEDAPADSKIYGRFNNNWIDLNYHYLRDAPDNKKYVKSAGLWIELPVDEAPKDSKQYVRRDGAWIHLDTQGTILEAPNDGKTYGRKENDWVDLDTTYIKDVNDTSKYIRTKDAWEVANYLTDANSDTNYYARKDGSWEALDEVFIKEAPSDRYGYVRKGNGWAQEAISEDAPIDEFVHGRGSGGWVEVTKEAPKDNKLYGRKNGDWEEITSTSGSGGINDAPSDDRYYARKNGEWKKLSGEDIEGIDNQQLFGFSYDGNIVSLDDTLVVDIFDKPNGLYFREKGSGNGGIWTKFDDSKYLTKLQAPEQDANYVLKNNSFVKLEGSGAGGGINDAPSDGSFYVRKDAQWKKIAPNEPDNYGEELFAFNKNGELSKIDEKYVQELDPVEGHRRYFARTYSSWVEIEPFDYLKKPDTSQLSYEKYYVVDYTGSWLGVNLKSDRNFEYWIDASYSGGDSIGTESQPFKDIVAPFMEIHRQTKVSYPQLYDNFLVGVTLHIKNGNYSTKTPTWSSAWVLPENCAYSYINILGESKDNTIIELKHAYVDGSNLFYKKHFLKSKDIGKLSIKNISFNVPKETREGINYFIDSEKIDEINIDNIKIEVLNPNLTNESEDYIFLKSNRINVGEINNTTFSNVSVVFDVNNSKFNINNVSGATNYFIKGKNNKITENDNSVTIRKRKFIQDGGNIVFSPIFKNGLDYVINNNEYVSNEFLRSVRYYVSNTGNDDNEGIDDTKPIKTLQKAFDKIFNSKNIDYEIVLLSDIPISDELRLSNKLFHSLTIRKSNSVNNIKIYLDAVIESRFFIIENCEGILNINNVKFSENGNSSFGGFVVFDNNQKLHVNINDSSFEGTSGENGLDFGLITARNGGTFDLDNCKYENYSYALYFDKVTAYVRKANAETLSRFYIYGRNSNIYKFEAPTTQKNPKISNLDDIEDCVVNYSNHPSLNNIRNVIVNVSVGNDETGNGTTRNPFKTMLKAFKMLPSKHLSSVYIGFTGAGDINETISITQESCPNIKGIDSITINCSGDKTVSDTFNEDDYIFMNISNSFIKKIDIMYLKVKNSTVRQIPYGLKLDFGGSTTLISCSFDGFTETDNSTYGVSCSKGFFECDGLNFINCKIPYKFFGCGGAVLSDVKYNNCEYAGNIVATCVYGSNIASTGYTNPVILSSGGELRT